MDLYRSLAPIYDELFPLPGSSVAFLQALARDSRRSSPRESGRAPRALDAGCATGALVLALAEAGWEAIGIEPETAMVALARAAASRRGLRARFLAGDMLEAESLAGPGPFDLVLCLGNTLPHLSREQASRFLAAARALLAPGGSLVLQLLNYARQGVGPGFAFPDIEARGLRFRRRYEAGPAGRLRFVTELSRSGKGDDDALCETVLGGERSATSGLLLEPMEPSWLREALVREGFGTPSLHAGWDGGPFDEDRDLYLVAVAPRP